MFFCKSPPSPGGGYDDEIAERIIPTDVLINILARLPAWSLQKLKSVSKEWFRVISDPDFAEAHVAYQSGLPTGSGILICCLQDVLFIGGTSSSIPNPPRRINLPRATNYTQVHGSCKGLVLYECCLLDSNVNDIQLQVANPLTGDSLSLLTSGPKHSFRSASIGFSSSSREIKVVLVRGNSHRRPSSPMLFFVLTLGSNKWRLLPAHFPQHHFMPYAPPTSAGGALHWRYATGILSLDLGQENFRQTDLTFCPEFPSHQGRVFCEWDGCLAFVHSQPKRSNQLYRVWVLRESGWSKHEPDIDSAFFRSLRPWENFSDSGLDCPYFSATMGNGRMLLFWKTCKTHVQLLAYDMDYKVLVNFTRFGRSFFKHYMTEECWSNNVHVNSLVLCSPPKASRKGKIKFLARVMRDFFG